MGKVFHETNYLSRRTRLQGQIANAERAYTEATIDLELGQVDQAAVTAARNLIATLRDQLAGVEAAYQRSLAQAAAEKAASDRAGRFAAIKAVETSLKKRKDAAVDIAEAAAVLGAAWLRFDAASQAVVDAVRPYSSDLGTDGVRELRDGLFGDFNSPKPFIGHALVDAGLKLSSVHFAEPHARTRGIGSGPVQTLSEFVEGRNRFVRNAVAAVEPDEAEAA